MRRYTPSAYSPQKRKERIDYLKKVLFLCLFAFLTTAMLLENEKALALSLTGLNLWFQKMIPTLLPFMILSGILIRMNLSDSFAHLFSPLFRPIFQLSDSCIYVLVIGFLCGFPMGARVTAESYQRGKLSRREAELMLAFCNNIGPIYFTGFVFHLFPVEHPWAFLAGMYLLPLLYGLFLRYTSYRDIPRPARIGESGIYKMHSSVKNTACMLQKPLPPQNKKDCPESLPFLRKCRIPSYPPCVPSPLLEAI